MVHSGRACSHTYRQRGDCQLNLQQIPKAELSLAMTYQMRQSIKILEMDAVELREYLQELSLENPVVELDSASGANRDGPLRNKKMEWLDLLAKNDRQNIGYYDSDKGDNNLEKTVASPQRDTLEDSLIAQSLLSCPADIFPAFEHVVGYLDDDGYLRATDDELLEAGRINRAKLMLAIEYLQGLEPAGVGARSLAECLLLQLPKEDILARSIVSNELECLARQGIARIASKLGVTKQEAEDAAARIRRLNPKPGSGFGNHRPPHYVTPDIIIVLFPDKYYVAPCDFAYPALNVNRQYVDMIQQTDDKEAGAYIEEKLKQIEWVQKCISNRCDTLLNVAKAIVRCQESFFRSGPQYMNTLRMSDIARELDMHESTVSRAIKNKYLQCPHGTFPMKYFFVQGARASGGEGASSHELKHRIKDIIAAEDKSSPLSDQRIAEMLGVSGEPISRRTVAKYREQLQIPKSGYRRA
jgi:RNA polymerase sigma-54 factor